MTEPYYQTPNFSLDSVGATCFYLLYFTTPVVDNDERPVCSHLVLVSSNTLLHRLTQCWCTWSRNEVPSPMPLRRPGNFPFPDSLSENMSEPAVSSSCDGCWVATALELMNCSKTSWDCNGASWSSVALHSILFCAYLHRIAIKFSV